MTAEVDYSPTEAARQLDVADSTLRKYAAAYESVFGALPQSTEGRRYTDTALQRLRVATQLQRDGKAHSVAAGLEMLKNGEVLALQERTPVSGHSVEYLLMEILKRLEAIEQRQLEAPQDNSELQADQVKVQELLEVNADLERRNKYLQGELQRRDKGAIEEYRRPWWQFWRRG